MKPPLAVSPDQMIACPRCDLLHKAAPQRPGSIARCTRCNAALITTREGAVARITALALTVLILMAAALFFPFLKMETGGFSNSASLFGAATAFHTGYLIPLSGVVAAFIIILPVLRVIAILYALLPLQFGRAPLRHAAYAFRLAEMIRPWAMAEIFIIGVAVALVKVTELADVSPGTAFWAFAALVVVIVLKDTSMCKWSIWNTLNPKSR